MNVYVITEIDNHWSLHLVSPQMEAIFTNLATEADAKELAGEEVSYRKGSTRIALIRKNGAIEEVGVEKPVA